MSPEWLTSVLKPELRADSQVVGVRYERIGGPGSFVGDLARLSLDYRGDGGGIRTVIAKIPTKDHSARARFAAAGFYYRENAFYRHLAESCGVRSPVAYYVAEDQKRTEYVLLLEDLGGMRTGDHLDGCSREDARLVVWELAKLHAHWWNDGSLEQYRVWLPAQTDAQTERWGSWFNSRLPELARSLAGLVSPDFAEVAQLVGRQYRDLWALQRLAPFAVNHGDCRLENVLFDKRGGKARPAFLDWQAVCRGNPLRDISYFLATNFETDRRRNEEIDLLTYYHEALMVNGVTNYSMEQCFDDFQRAGLLLVGAVAWVAASLGDEPTNPEGQQLLRRLIRRQAQAALDADPANTLAR